MIDFIFKLDKEHRSSCQIKKDDVTIHLTESDLSRLIAEMYRKRDDAFEEILYPLKRENSDLKHDVDNLAYELDKLRGIS